MAPGSPGHAAAAAAAALAAAGTPRVPRRAAAAVPGVTTASLALGVLCEDDGGVPPTTTSVCLGMTVGLSNLMIGNKVSVFHCGDSSCPVEYCCISLVIVTTNQVAQRWLHLELRQTCCILHFTAKCWVVSNFNMTPKVPQVACHR